MYDEYIRERGAGGRGVCGLRSTISASYILKYISLTDFDIKCLLVLWFIAINLVRLTRLLVSGVTTRPATRFTVSTPAQPSVCEESRSLRFSV